MASPSTVRQPAPQANANGKTQPPASGGSATAKGGKAPKKTDVGATRAAAARASGLSTGANRARLLESHGAVSGAEVAYRESQAIQKTLTAHGPAQASVQLQHTLERHHDEGYRQAVVNDTRATVTQMGASLTDPKGHVSAAAAKQVVSSLAHSAQLAGNAKGALSQSFATGLASHPLNTPASRGAVEALGESAKTPEGAALAQGHGTLAAGRRELRGGRGAFTGGPEWSPGGAGQSA